MTADDYIRDIVARRKAPTGQGSPGYKAASFLMSYIKAWAGMYLLDVKFSGSYAKGTAIRGDTDVDLFISLNPNTPGTLKDIYSNLAADFSGKGFQTREQNVSVSVIVDSIKVDLVPGRKQAGYTTDHSLYRRKADTWTQTNVDKHIQVIRDSWRVDDICAVKVWRQLHGLDFPSFLLELTVISALSGRRTDQPANNLLAALHYIADNLTTARVVDPANTNNIVSNDMTTSEKQRVVAQAKATLSQSKWGDILW